MKLVLNASPLIFLAKLLLLANAKGLISGTLVKLKLQALIEHHGFYLSLRVMEKVQDMLVE